MLTLLNNQPYEELVDAINNKAQTSGAHNIDELISLVDGIIPGGDVYPPVETPTIMDFIQVNGSNIDIQLAKFTDYPATLKINGTTQNLHLGYNNITLNTNESYTLEFSNIFDLSVYSINVPTPQSTAITITVGYFNYDFFSMFQQVSNTGINYIINATSSIDVNLNMCNSFTFNAVSERIEHFNIHYRNSGVYAVSIPEGLKYLKMLNISNVQQSTLMLPYTLDSFGELSCGTYTNIRNIVIGDNINGSNIKTVSPQSFVVTTSDTTVITGSYVRILAQAPPEVIERTNSSMHYCFQYETLEIPAGTLSAYTGSAFANLFPNATITEM